MNRGFCIGAGVTVNINSAKALNSVVGHEITHVLEGTELYNEMQSAIVEYAKSKGDYQGRYDTLAELYKDIDGANINAELTADLVGDYLFTDADFIKRLSTEHRNVFQKLYDEIKYLCKIATAGSKEAKELEKVKKLFEDAYRTETKNPTNDGGTKYSINTTENGTKYVKLDGNIFRNEDGSSMTPREAYNSLVGQKITLEDGDVITFIKKLPKRDVYKELFLKLPGYEDGIDVKAVSEKINQNIIEVITASQAQTRNEAQRHPHIGIKDFDQREVYLVDNSDAYRLELCIANLTDGTKIAYVKRYIEKASQEIAEEIKKAETAEQIRLNQPSDVGSSAETDNLHTTDSIRNPDEKVNGKFSLSETKDTAPVGEYRITGEDIALAPTKEDIARMEQERIATAQNAPRNDVEDLGAPTREDIARMEWDAETKNTTNDRVVKNKISDLDIDRKYIDFKDTSKANEVVDAKVSDLVERGKVVPLSNKNIAKYKDGADWSKFKEVRQLLRDVLMPNRDISVVFEYGEQGAVAYLTSKGINHSVGGPASPAKAAAFEQFRLLVKNAEYVYSSNNDIHNDANKNIDGDILWDTFVAVGTINGEPYPVTFKIRSIDADVRSQIYEMATKNETGFSHEDGDQNDLTHAHSNYGTSLVSGERVTQDSGKVNGKFSISKTEDTALRNDGEELGAPTREDIARAEVMQAEAEKELHGPWRMTDPLDQKVEKLFRMMLREEVSEQDYMAQLVKADRQYQQRGGRVEEALERVREAYSKEATATPEIEKKVERLTRKVLQEGIMGRMKDALAEKKPRFDVNRGVLYLLNPNRAKCFRAEAGCGKFRG